MRLEIPRLMAVPVALEVTMPSQCGIVGRWPGILRHPADVHEHQRGRRQTLWHCRSSRRHIGRRLPGVDPRSTWYARQLDGSGDRSFTTDAGSALTGRRPYPTNSCRSAMPKGCSPALPVSVTTA